MLSLTNQAHASHEILKGDGGRLGVCVWYRAMSAHLDDDEDFRGSCRVAWSIRGVGILKVDFE